MVARHHRQIPGWLLSPLTNGEGVGAMQYVQEAISVIAMASIVTFTLIGMLSVWRVAGARR